MAEPTRRDDTASSPSAPVLRDRRAFLDRVREERVRSDRGDYPISVLVYSGAGADEELAHALAERVRTDDAVGLLDGGEVGVLLLHADLEEAERIAAAIVADLVGSPDDLACVVHPHPPLPWRAGDDEGSGTSDGQGASG